MSTAIETALIVLGILILYWGASWLVHGSATIARGLGVKPLVLGLTVIAYGTSAPELAVATKAAAGHAHAIAIGTVLGSCAANISLILGLTALIAPFSVEGRVIRREAPILLGAMIAVPLCLLDGKVSRIEGGLLVLCAVLFTVITLTVSARAPRGLGPGQSGVMPGLGPRDDDDDDPVAASRLLAILLTGAGLGLLLVGSNLFLRGARSMAADIGMSERMLGLSVIALGTSLPELLAAVLAAKRGEGSLAIGSVIGANLLNVFLVLGAVSSLRPVTMAMRVHAIDLIGVVAITCLAIFMLRGERVVKRWEGAVLVISYIAFQICAALF